MFSLLGNYNNIWKSEINSSGERNRTWYLKSFILNANHIHQHLGGMQGFMNVTENILRLLLRLVFKIHGEIFACYFFFFTSHNTQVLICHIYRIWVKIQLQWNVYMVLCFMEQREHSGFLIFIPYCGLLILEYFFCCLSSWACSLICFSFTTKTALNMAYFNQTGNFTFVSERKTRKTLEFRVKVCLFMYAHFLFLYLS